jgi:hypothetical protein
MEALGSRVIQGLLTVWLLLTCQGSNRRTSSSTAPSMAFTSTQGIVNAAEVILDDQTDTLSKLLFDTMLLGRTSCLV